MVTEIIRTSNILTEQRAKQLSKQHLTLDQLWRWLVRMGSAEVDSIMRNKFPKGLEKFGGKSDSLMGETILRRNAELRSRKQKKLMQDEDEEEDQADKENQHDNKKKRTGGP